jgi:hypothetical protein
VEIVWRPRARLTCRMRWTVKLHDHAQRHYEHHPEDHLLDRPPPLVPDQPPDSSNRRDQDQGNDHAPIVALVTRPCKPWLRPWTRPERPASVPRTSPQTSRTANPGPPAAHDDHGTPAHHAPSGVAQPDPSRKPTGRECAKDATLPPVDSTIVAALISAGGEVLEQGRLVALRPGWRGMCQRGVESVPLGEDLGRVSADDPRPCVLVWLLAGLQLTWPRLPPRPGGGPGRSPRGAPRAAPAPSGPAWRGRGRRAAKPG